MIAVDVNDTFDNNISYVLKLIYRNLAKNLFIGTFKVFEFFLFHDI